MENSDDVEENDSSNLILKHYYPDFSRKLVCVQYPAIVNNVNRMLETLGGKSNLETVVGNSSKKLELRFRPKDIFCKPCAADRDYKPGILLKLKIRQSKINTEDAAGPSSAPAASEPIIIGYEVAGVTAMSFKFNRLNDFQYLPLVPPKGNEEEKHVPLEYIYDKIFPEKIPDIKWLLSEESQTMPCFLPPTIFSRFTSSYNKLYFERSEIYNSTLRPELQEQLLQFERQSEMRKMNRETQSDMTSEKLSIIHSSRRSRRGCAVVANFNDPELPKEAPEKVVASLRVHAVKNVTLDQIKELFEERPIWSKAAVAYKTGISEATLKYVLPSVAYYFINGPWRVMWVRYGYDPRKDPSARIYQTFDFRIRDMDTIIQRRRTLGTSKAAGKIEKFSLKGDLKTRSPYPRQIGENYFLLRPGVIPPGRQIFYQYCNLLLPEIQNMLARLPEVTTGKECDFKNGWLPEHFYEQCKEVATKYVQEQAKKEFLEVKNRAISTHKAALADSEEANEVPEEDIGMIVIDDDSTDDEELRQPDEVEDEDEEDWNSADEETNQIDMEVVEEVSKSLSASESKQQAENDQDDYDIETKTIEAFAKMLREDDDL